MIFDIMIFVEHYVKLLIKDKHYHYVVYINIYYSSILHLNQK